MKHLIVLALVVPFVFGFGVAPNRNNQATVNRNGIGGGQNLVGGYRIVDDVNGRFIRTASDKAIELMNVVKTEGSSNNAMPLRLQSIISARTKAVAGTVYDIQMDVNIDGQITRCHVEITNLYPWMDGGMWSVKIWEDDATDPCSEFIPSENNNGIVKRSTHLLGGEKEVDTGAEDVQKVVQFAVEHINSMSNSLYMQASVKIFHVTKQVINGYRYRFQVMTAETSCRNNDENRHKTLSDCPVNDGGMLQTCDVSVIDKRGEYSFESSKCKPVKQKPIIGGDDHDYLPYGGDKPILGGDDHDYLPHGTDKPILGGDDHDYLPHGNEIKNALPGFEDFLPQKPYMHMARKVESQPLTFGKGLLSSANNLVKHMKIGGDSHDYLPHDTDDGCTEHLGAFRAFKDKYNKVYESARMEAKRFQIFCANMEKIKAYQKQEQGTATYGVTKFADMSEAEFKHIYLGFRPELATFSWPTAEIPSDSIPDSWDWRDHGAVTPVKNQGSCGSCWAFSTTGNIEGQYAVKSPKHKLYSLSEQELVDCDKIDEGCNGGLPSQAYAAIMKLGGIETESDYKYDGHDEKCKFKKQDVVVKLKGAVNITSDETEMAKWLYKNGPISIGINAFAMQFYMGGIAHPWKIFCNPKSLDHGVLIVGYGSENGEPYWIIKNSWGADWGREGYYYVYRGDGTCGLNTMCTSAVVDTE